jgi:hypothetical protein
VAVLIDQLSLCFCFSYSFPLQLLAVSSTLKMTPSPLKRSKPIDYSHPLFNLLEGLPAYIGRPANEQQQMQMQVGDQQLQRPSPALRPIAGSSSSSALLTSPRLSLGPAAHQSQPQQHQLVAQPAATTATSSSYTVTRYERTSSNNNQNNSNNNAHAAGEGALLLAPNTVNGGDGRRSPVPGAGAGLAPQQQQQQQLHHPQPLLLLLEAEALARRFTPLQALV